MDKTTLKQRRTKAYLVKIHPFEECLKLEGSQIENLWQEPELKNEEVADEVEGRTSSLGTVTV